MTLERTYGGRIDASNLSVSSRVIFCQQVGGGSDPSSAAEPSTTHPSSEGDFGQVLLRIIAEAKGGFRSLMGRRDRDASAEGSTAYKATVSLPVPITVSFP